MGSRRPLEDLVSDPVPYLEDADDGLRRLAVSACASRLDDGSVRHTVLTLLEADPAATVRAEAAEVLGTSGHEVGASLLEAVDDDDRDVAEAAVAALGEVRYRPAVPRLIDLAEGDGDRLLREAAVASLGAMGDARAVPALLRQATAAPPQVRRRAVVALTAFDDPEAEVAIRAATKDRNPMVNEVAELIVGRSVEDR